MERNILGFAVAFGLVSVVLGQFGMFDAGSQMAQQGAQVAGQTPMANNPMTSEVGKAQCKGFDHFTGTKMVGTAVGDSGVDFGGDYLCGPTCGGECQPKKDQSGDGPVSGYSFGCKCPQQRCSGTGPVIEEMKSESRAKTSFKVICVKDLTCTCKGMDADSATGRDGYLCNWINFNANSTTDTSDKVKPQTSPIRWCACCPK